MQQEKEENLAKDATIEKALVEEQLQNIFGACDSCGRLKNEALALAERAKAYKAVAENLPQNSNGRSTFMIEAYKHERAANDLRYTINNILGHTYMPKIK